MLAMLCSGKTRIALDEQPSQDQFHSRALAPVVMPKLPRFSACRAVPDEHGQGCASDSARSSASCRVCRRENPKKYTGPGSSDLCLRDVRKVWGRESQAQNRLPHST